MEMRERAVSFLRELFHIYLELRDYDRFLDLLSPDVWWVEIEGREVCLNYEGICTKLRRAPVPAPNARILDFQCQAKPLGVNAFLACGSVRLCYENCNKTGPFYVLCFSMLCTETKLGFRLLHAQLSPLSNEDVRQNYQHSQRQLADDLHLRTMELLTIFDNVSFGIIKIPLSVDEPVQSINPYALQMLGYTREQFRDELQDRFIKVLPTENLANIHKNMQLLRGNGGSIQFQTEALRRDGSLILLGGTGICIPGVDGEPTVMVTLQDITEAERTRRLLLAKNDALVFSEKRYEIAMLHAAMSIFDYIPVTGQLLYSAPGNAPVRLGGTVKATLEKKLVPESSAAAFRKLFWQIDNGESSACAELLLYRADGQEVFYEISINSIFGANGKPVRAIGVITDITERGQLQSERRFRESMAYGRLLTYEANITRNTVVSIDPTWATEFCIPQPSSYTDMVEHIASTMLHPTDANDFRVYSDAATILANLEAGKKQVSTQYRRTNGNDGYNWVQNTMNIIRDDVTGDLRARCFVKIVNEQKKKELRIQEEQRYYELMIARSATVYEVNLTTDLFVRGQESWTQLFGIENTGHFSEMLDQFIQRILYPEDVEIFRKTFQRDSVLAAFAAGKTELKCDYRRMDEKKGLLWYQCTMHLFEDFESDELRSFCYVQDINEEKVKELALIYKSEHDPMTELYNKGTIESVISKYLASPEGSSGKHAFFIIDVDRFKQINDQFGHAFGDAVLSEVSRKLREAFRDSDLIGRIGGDEFVVLMKNIMNEKYAAIKAREICDIMEERLSVDEKQQTLSISIGIALYPNHGKSYPELYVHSDTALYATKENGRNGYSLYASNMRQKENLPAEIEDTGLTETKYFAENMVESVFRILYESPDKSTAIHAVLMLVGNHFNMSRAYIFEDTNDGLYTCNTFEWCAEDILPQMQNLARVPYSALGDYRANFNEHGIFYLPDIRQVIPSVQQVLAPQNIKSMVQFAIRKQGRFLGFIGFDECEYIRSFPKSELTNLKNISNILGVFIMEMRAAQLNETTRDLALSIVNALESYSYVIDPESYELLFINNKTLSVAPNAHKGHLCHKAFWNNDEPCPLCPIKKLDDSGRTSFTMELYNPHLNIWSQCTASWIDWTNGRRVCLVDSVDISKYKQNSQ